MDIRTGCLHNIEMLADMTISGCDPRLMTDLDEQTALWIRIAGPGALRSACEAWQQARSERCEHVVLGRLLQVARAAVEAF